MDNLPVAKDRSLTAQAVLPLRSPTVGSTDTLLERTVTFVIVVSCRGLRSVEPFSVRDENRRLRFGQRQELIYDKGQAHFDGTALTDVGLSDLDPELLARYLEILGGTEVERVLRARLLMTRRAELTAGGYLLFGRQPQDRFPEAYVRVLRYDGTDRQTGRRQNLLADLRCEGSIPAIITEARKAIERLEPARRVLGQAGRFVREGLIPADAWLEGVVNAVIHRSYSLGGDHIRVEILDNRIEIESPGRFPGVVGLEDPRGVARFARNPRIARVCADFQFGQEMGEGIRRMFDEMRTAGLADPVYQQRPGSVRLVLAATTLSQELAARLPSRSREVMEMIRNAGASARATSPMYSGSPSLRRYDGCTPCETRA